MKLNTHSQALRLANKFTRVIALIELLRPFLETMASHPEHNPIDRDYGEPLPFSEAAGALLKELDEYLEWGRKLDREIESRPQ